MATSVNIAATRDAETRRVAPPRSRRATLRSLRLMSFAERLADFIAVFIGVITADLIYGALGVGRSVHYSFATVVAFSAVVAMVFIVALDRNRGYQDSSSLLQIRETERILRSVVHTAVLLIAVVFISARPISRGAAAIAFFLIPIVVIAEKQLFMYCMRALHVRNVAIQNVLIYGGGESGRRIASALLKSPKLGLRPVVIVDDDPTRDGTE
ncbi:MAG TPA: hypothetical protein VJU82_06585, partial [Acidobacteriaceae bacterium]|nr:hypothetical protein [Acidobacteriaceae bacterium]